VTAQRLQEGLEAAADHAAQDRAVDLHVADPGRARYLPGRSGADEPDRDPAYRRLLSHARDVKTTGPALASVDVIGSTRRPNSSNTVDDRVSAPGPLDPPNCFLTQSTDTRRIRTEEFIPSKNMIAKSVVPGG